MTQPASKPPGLILVAIALSLAAGLLLDAAHSPAQPADLPPAEKNDPASRLTQAQINRIRFMELKAARALDRGPENIEPDRVIAVVPNEILNRFIAAKRGERGFQGDEAVRRLRAMTPPQKLAVLAYWVHDTPEEFDYADSVKVERDPEIIVDFRRHVQPLLIAGCATSACHGNADTTDTHFRLYNDPRRPEKETYANFLALREWRVGGQRLIDRDRPEESLLLSYLLRDNQTVHPHPKAATFRALYASSNTPGYKTIQRWINALRRLHPERGYGFRLFPQFAETTSAPDDETSPDTPDVEPTP